MKASEYLDIAIDTPWRAWNEVRRLACHPFFRAYIAWKKVKVGRGVKSFGLPLVQQHRGSVIEIGDRVVMRSWGASNPLVPYHRIVLATREKRARIHIGSDCGLTGSTIVASLEIILGERVLLGANSIVVDSDFHPLRSIDRKAGQSHGATAAVRIESDVFLGMNSIVLKGVRVGRGSVIGAGSVVVNDIPAGCVAAGNPATVVRWL